MAVSLIPEYSMVVDAGPGQPAGLSKRMKCEIVRGQLELERGTFLSHWRDLSQFIQPRRARFSISDVNKGDRRNQSIIDSTATEAVATLQAGMMSGTTNPSRPWFKLTMPDQELAEQADVKAWLYEVQHRMEMVFLRSNLYKILPIVYGDLGTFGTAAMAVEEDDETVIRCRDFPIGSYAIANDAKLRVRTFVRTFQLMVSQLVEQFGEINPKTGLPNFLDGRPTTLSLTVQNLWTRGTYNAWINVVHLIQPNLAYDGAKIDSKYKRYESVYYELGAPNQPIDPAQYGLLSHEGFDEFPILCPRWEVNSEDVYGTNCPGMKALGDIKQLQLGEKRSAQAIEKMINPPMTGPSALRQAKASLLPGDITYLDVRDGVSGFRPVHEIKFDVAALEQKQQQVRQRVERAFKVDLFRLLIQSDRRDYTAREIDELHDEKMLGMGPVLQQTEQDLYDPLIDRTFAIMLRKGLIPDPPPSIQGAFVHPEYVSILAQAQKMVGLQALDRFAAFVAQLAQTAPDVLDQIDDAELIGQYAEAAGVPPKILRSPDAVAALRQARQQAQAQQQAAENAPKLAGAVQSLSQAPTGGDSILSKLVNRAAASRTLAAAPPPS